jgi:hypothetical protein
MILNWTVDLEQPSVSMFFKMVSRGLDPTTAKVSSYFCLFLDNSFY